MAEWANDALQGLGKGAPFSLCLTKNYFSRVASGYGKSGNEFTTVSLLIYNTTAFLSPVPFFFVVIFFM